MKTIWKYTFEITDDVTIAMPSDSKILHVECQRGDPTMWVLVNPDSKRVVRKFRIFGTGHPIAESEKLEFVGTFQQPPFVWHMFEVF